MTNPKFEVHQDWSTPGFDLSPIAGATGPFVRRDLLNAWHRHRGQDGTVLLVESAAALLPLFQDTTSLRFVGEADLTDYHSPLGASDAIRSLAGAFFAGVAAGTTVTLDSLPAEAATPLETGLVDAGIDIARDQYEVAAVLTLPGSFDEWLSTIGKKERHEVRRKRRRFEEELGPPHLERVSGPDALATFADMHRSASGDKGTFMTPDMTALFFDLHHNAGAVIDVLSSHAGDPVAAAFGFEDDTGYYLYNSAYSPNARSASPGIVMLASLIERAIGAGKTVFDFLKGDEPYKFRHGAQPRPLYSLTGTVQG